MIDRVEIYVRSYPKYSMYYSSSFNNIYILTYSRDVILMVTK